MARGDRPVALEQLVPYFRGARYAALMASLRHAAHDDDLRADIESYIAMVDEYTDAAIATYRITREKQRVIAAAGAAPHPGAPSPR